MEAGAVPRLAKLLASPHDGMREQVRTYEWRKAPHHFGIFPGVLAILGGWVGGGGGLSLC